MSDELNKTPKPFRKIQLLINIKKKAEEKMNGNKLKSRTYFDGEENFYLELSSPPGGEENFRWRGKLRIEVRGQNPGMDTFLPAEPRFVHLSCNILILMKNPAMQGPNTELCS